MRRKIKESLLRARPKNEAVEKISIALGSENLALATNGLDKIVKEPTYVQCVTQERAQVSKLQDEDRDDTSLASRWASHFGEQSEHLPEISIKNTFIQVSAFPTEPPTKSAPGALLPQRFRFKLKQNEGEVVTPDALQSIASPKEAPAVVVSLSRTTTNRQTGEDMDSSMERAEVTSGEKAGMSGGSEAHLLGQCIPCAYFWYKRDGCRLGKNCEFCHCCEKGEIKNRKRERIQQLKAVGEYIPRFSQRQEK